MDKHVYPDRAVRPVHGLDRDDHVSGEGGARQGQGERQEQGHHGQDLEQDGGQSHAHGIGVFRYQPVVNIINTCARNYWSKSSCKFYTRKIHSSINAGTITCMFL